VPSQRFCDQGPRAPGDSSPRPDRRGVCRWRPMRPCVGPHRPAAGHGANGRLVAEGRDIGTGFFPDADFEVFLNPAFVQERAQAARPDLEQRGFPRFRSLTEGPDCRTHRLDSGRAVAPARSDDDAIELDSADGPGDRWRDPGRLRVSRSRERCLRKPGRGTYWFCIRLSTL